MLSLPGSKSYDAIVLGGGISGLTAAHALAAQGQTVCIIDDYPKLGGNHLSRSIGPYSFDIGAIFFWSDSPLFDMFPRLKAEMTPIAFSVCRVNPTGDVQAYPYSVQNEFLTAPLRLKLRVLGQIVLKRLRRPRLRNAGDWADYLLGSALFQASGLSHYIQRLYALQPSEVSLEFAHRRMRWIRDKVSLPHIIAARWRRLLRAASFDRSGALVCFARPASGFGPLYDTLRAELSARGIDVLLDAGMRRIDTGNGFAVWTRHGVVRSGRLISTLPLNHATDLAGLDRIDEIEAMSTSMTTLFCSFDGTRGFDSVVLYNFHASGLWKRLTMHSDYYGRRDGREFFSVEITHRETGLQAATLFADFRHHSASVGLFAGDLRLEGSMLTDFAYPLARIGFETSRDAAIAQLESVMIETLGRQGRLDYIASSTLAVSLVRETLAEPRT